MKKRHKIKLITKDTGRYGKGIFADEDIEKGTVIYVLHGRRMDISDFIKVVNSGKEYIDDPFQIGKRTYLDLDALSRTFNHSCDPNGGIRKNSELFALQNIKKGDEITYDYSATIAPTEWKMECKCGSAKCRKMIGDILSVPKGQLKKYEKASSLQGYMKRLLKEMRQRGKYVLPKYEILALEKLRKT